MELTGVDLVTVEVLTWTMLCWTEFSLIVLSWLRLSWLEFSWPRLDGLFELINTYWPDFSDNILYRGGRIQRKPNGFIDKACIGFLSIYSVFYIVYEIEANI